jgi:murein DD-endopeptidase MepM/ murein hydrolase activator NlpD
VARRIINTLISIRIRLGKRLRREYYYLEDGSPPRSVKRFRLKFAGAVALSTALCLALVLVANHLLDDPLDLGYLRANRLLHENEMLQERIGGIKGKLAELEGAFNLLNEQGNRLRLLVDLPRLDDATATAGTGGAAADPTGEMGSGDAGSVMRSAASTLRQLESRLQVQEQSYRQIVNKSEYNKGYFAALPALKPMEGFYSVGEFGLRMHPVLGIFKTHEGLDIVNDVGTPVVAAGDAIVEMAGQSGGGYGITVVLKHGYGYQTLYAHLSKVLVHAGQRVVRGQVIAKSGKTGLVSGPHLHYEVRYNGVSKNPADYFLDDVKPLDYRARLAAH